MMKNKSLSFRENKIFSYGKWNKIGFGIFIIFLMISVILLIASYFFQRDSNIFIFKSINGIINHVSLHIWNAHPLGILYTTSIGGLFFISIPIEVLYFKFLKAGHPFLIITALYLLGLLFSFSINYLIGFKLSGFSKKVISPKKFYKLKGFTNKYGAWAVFLFNALPLPSQQLSVILGVFRYNKARFYIFFLLGQFVKYNGMYLIYRFF